MDKKVKWGVLGYARIAQNSVIPAILKSSNSELYAVASRDPRKLSDCMNKFECKKSYECYEDLLEDPEIQAVYIPLPNHLHKEWTIKALKKGKHVLCEKPLALNSHECMEMIETAKKYNVNLMEAFMYRFNNKIKKILEIIHKGSIGEIKVIHSTFGIEFYDVSDYRMKSSMGGGALYDVGCYPIHLAGMITGASPVSMKVESIDQDGVDHSLCALLRYEKGIICSISCWFNAFQRVFTEITGTSGRLEIPDTFFGNAGMIKVINHEGVEELEIPESSPYVLEIEDFADTILHHKKTRFNIDESVRNIRIIENLLKESKK